MNCNLRYYYTEWALVNYFICILHATLGEAEHQGIVDLVKEHVQLYSRKKHFSALSALLRNKYLFTSSKIRAFSYSNK